MVGDFTGVVDDFEGIDGTLKGIQVGFVGLLPGVPE